MTDQHAHAGYVGHDGYLSGSSGHDGNSAPSHTTGGYDADPLFGAMQGGYAGQNGYAAGRTGQFDTGTFDTGAFASSYDTTGQWTVPHQATAYEPDGATGTFDTGSFATGAFDTTGQWDANAWHQAQGTGQYDNSAFTSAYDTTGQWAVPGTQSETGTYDATAWNAMATAATTTMPAQPEAQLPYETAEFPQAELADEFAEAFTDEPAPEPEPADLPADLPGAAVPGSRAEARRNAGRRRRSPAKRSALLTVAVPSVCVMGVAGVAVASVGGLTGGKDDGGTVTAASDPASVKPVAANTKLDTQLANLSADANGFADRASRTQERIDLKARQDAEKKKKEDAAAAKEAARPKFVLPVTQKGLSAYYGQAGVNWMSVHTGIDFPVSYGTPVMSAIDGTVRTQWNSAYGNMAIVTGADGTETWYCHLSSTKIRSGPVKAGDVIAYSGNSGNSTGPHLHFEVRPGGGSSIDPLPWLRSHDLDPT
ncbi:M23 family metallopeptidase [Streptomyces sp. NBC_00212]|uniref:M23 family metallopeptidase n=1 Tax=Streptomyces sp. NBC_00212 TaxID=2975684 RepID=UPI003255A540